MSLVAALYKDDVGYYFVYPDVSETKYRLTKTSTDEDFHKEFNELASLNLVTVPSGAAQRPFPSFYDSAALFYILAETPKEDGEQTNAD